ncbi:serine hydrolase domain-containing protein [Polymorphospora lycopeni]|uniref:Serine hydrolase domain-containing protein n=1 Tax=Polymorphospora lycopeni TaxID=3140240 RepID=A0ABV5CK21_9ACTN
MGEGREGGTTMRVRGTTERTGRPGHWRWLLTLALMVPVVALVTPAASAWERAEVESVLDGYVRDVRPPGAALVVLAGGTPRTLVRGEDGAGRPVDADTLFRIGSMSKAFTALAVLQQVDAGRFGLTDPVVDVLPDFRMGDPGHRSITVRDLLTHRSGISAVAREYAARPAGSPAEVVESVAGHSLAAEPGTRTEYSNTGYGILARIVEVSSGTEFNAYLGQRVFAPLGMTSTTSTNLCDARPDGLTNGFSAVLALRLAVPEMPGTCAGSGGIVSTATDMGRWLAFQLGDGTSAATGERLLREPTLRSMHDVPDRAGEYGFGWRDTSAESDTEPFVGHGGTLATYASSIEFSPRTGTGAVALTNAAGEPTLLTHNAIAALDGGPRQAITNPYDGVNIFLAALSGVVLILGCVGLLRARRWAGRRTDTTGRGIVLRLAPLVLSGLLGTLLPVLVGALMGLVDIVSYRLVLWLFPMVYVLGTAIVLSCVAVVVARLTRLRAARRAGAAVAGPHPVTQTV